MNKREFFKTIGVAAAGAVVAPAIAFASKSYRPISGMLQMKWADGSKLALVRSNQMLQYDHIDLWHDLFKTKCIYEALPDGRLVGWSIDIKV